MEEESRMSAKTSVLKENPASVRAETGSEASGEVRETDILKEYLEFQCPSPPLISQTHWKEVALQQPTAFIFPALTAGPVRLTNTGFLWDTDNGWEAAGAATETMPMEKVFEQTSTVGLLLCLWCCAPPITHIAALFLIMSIHRVSLSMLSNWIDDPGDWRSWPIHKTSGTQKAQFPHPAVFLAWLGSSFWQMRESLGLIQLLQWRHSWCHLGWWILQWGHTCLCKETLQTNLTGSQLSVEW